MHQTISGETPKTEILKREKLEEFLKKNKEKFDDVFENSNKIIYESKDIVNDHVLNFLNLNEDLDFVKDIIRKEFDECEKIYPYLGDIFINLFFDKIRIKKNSKFKFSKNNEKYFLKTIDNEKIKNLAKLIFENVSLEYMINVKNFEGEKIIVEKNNDINIDLEFDESYYQDTAFKKIKNYNCIVIDGIIDTVGEIHHLLYRASQNKEDYVIFCLGINDEVKHTIMTNNKKRITKVWPVDIKMSEKALNILNDISIIHDTEIISALKGQTISQEIKKQLKKGKGILIDKGKITVERNCSIEKITAHKNFLLKRINESSNEENSKLIKRRYKSMSNKTLNIFLPSMICNSFFLRELDYFLRFISNLNKIFTIVEIKNKKYYMPTKFLTIANQKSDDCKKIISNIEKIIRYI